MLPFDSSTTYVLLWVETNKLIQNQTLKPTDKIFLPLCPSPLIFFDTTPSSLIDSWVVKTGLEFTMQPEDDLDVLIFLLLSSKSRY